MMPVVIAGVVELTKQWLSNRKEKSQAKHEREVKAINGELGLDNTNADGMRFSWKDEWLTAVFTTPIVTIFYGAIFNKPEVIDRMANGMKVISDLPEWYQVMLGGIVTASFGLLTYQRLKK